MTYRVEPAAATDLHYVLSTWGRVLETKLEAMPMPGFLKAFAPLQAKIIKRSSVLCALGEDGKIAGFCIYEPGVLHWVTVRPEHQKKGVAAALIEAAKLVNPIVTFWTSDLRRLHLADARYTPFWLRS